MTKPSEPKGLKRESSFRMLFTLSAISLISGLLIVSAVEITREPIRMNREEMVKKSISQLFTTSSRTQKFSYQDILESGENLDVRLSNSLFYGVYDSAGSFLGVAVEAAGMGFQDMLKIIYGYEVINKNIVGMVVLESKETPGLGDKIEKDIRFQKNFTKLPVDLNSTADPFELVKKNSKTKPTQIEAITGATISSRAITNILNTSAALHLKRINKALGKIKEMN